MTIHKRLSEGTIQMRQVSCGIVFNKEGQVLMGKRVKATSLFWSFLGGKVEDGEHRYVALVREMFEEAGIVVLEADIIHVTNYDNDTVLYMYVIKRWISEPVNREPESHSEIGWFDLENLPQPIGSGIVELLKQKIKLLIAYRDDYIRGYHDKHDR